MIPTTLKRRLIIEASLGDQDAKYRLLTHESKCAETWLKHILTWTIEDCEAIVDDIEARREYLRSIGGFESFLMNIAVTITQKFDVSPKSSDQRPKDLIWRLGALSKIGSKVIREQLGRPQ